MPELKEMEEKCFSDPWSEKILQETFENPTDYIFVLEDQGSLIGYVNVRVGIGQGELMRIAVIPERRGEKLSVILMKRAMNCLKGHGCREVTLEVRAGNIPAVMLYESFGFVREGLRRGYYQNPEEDAAVYWQRDKEKQ